MRSRLLLCLVIAVIVLSAAPLFAQEPVPAFTGSKAEFQLNLTQKDFLPVIRQWIGMLPGFAGTIAEMGAAEGGGQIPDEAKVLAAIAEEAVKEIQVTFAGVNQVSVVAYQRPENVAAYKISEFYAQAMGLNKGWMKTLVIERPEGSARLYVKPDLNGMFAIGMSPDYVVAGRVDGKIDLIVLGKMVAKYAPVIASHFGTSSTQTFEIPAPESAGWEVTLTEIGPQRVRVLGVIREVTGLSPSEARDFAESLPQSLMSGLSQEDADALASRLMSIGAKVEVVEHEAAQ